MKYLIIGCGAVGGAVCAFLANKNHSIDCIARGNTLKQLKENGLILHSESIGNKVFSNINFFSEEEYTRKADVIFVCVKDYSLEQIYSVIEKSSHSETLVIPLLNTFNVGRRILENVSIPVVYDGCIYIISELEAPGIIKQTGDIFRVICGSVSPKTANKEMIDKIQSDFTNAGVYFKVSDDINSAKFIKFSLTSALASTCSYFDITSEAVIQEGEYRDFLKDALAELKLLAKAMDLDITFDIVNDNLNIIDKFPPKTTTSMQRDLRANKISEIDGMVFQVINLAKKHNVNTPCYNKVGEKFSSVSEKFSLL